MTTAPASPGTKPVSVADRIAEHTRARITEWQRGYLADRPQAVAALARLRRGAGREAGDLPDLWTLIDLGPLHSPPSGQRPVTEEELVPVENAVHAAFTLWAYHQQSRGDGMHRRHSAERPAGLGAAVRRLMPADDIDEAVLKRFVRVGSAPDFVSVTQRLRDIVALLRRESVPLDYGLLAGQLHAWQQPDGPTAVRRAWGRSFHLAPRKPRKPADGSTTADPSNTASLSNTPDAPTIPDTDKDAS